MIEAPTSTPTGSQRRWPRKRHLVEGALIICFWGALAILKVTQHAIDPIGRGPGAGEIKAGLVAFIFLEYALWVVATPLAFWLAVRFSPEGKRWALHLGIQIAMAIAVPVVVDLASHAIWNAVVSANPRPVSLAAVLHHFHFLPELLLYLFILATGLARAYFFRYRERVIETARLRAETAELEAHSAGLQAQLSDARLEALRMQLNPHFLFNTLNAISAYVDQDPAGVRRMIARLSDLLRYTLERKDVREVPLRQELQFIDRYLELQRFRFEERLAIRKHIDPAALDALVPTLILQPLVENAIKHGIGHREDGGRLELHAWRDGDALHLIVRDDGPGLDTAAGEENGSESSGIGIRNTQERLSSLYGSGHQFTLAPAEGGGLDAHIVLPYHTGTDLYTSVINHGAGAAPHPPTPASPSNGGL